MERRMMRKTTLRLRVDSALIDSAQSRAAIAHGAEVLRSGGTVAFPTETVYGLGANALDAHAVAEIFAAKERPAWDPLIVHISDAAMLANVTREIAPAARKLMEAFWPGPLTLLLPRGQTVPDAVTAGRDLVGVRMPRHTVARALIAAARVPIAAPSANRFGRTSPTTADHVLEDLDGRIDAVIDGGPTELGVESTVVAASESGIVCYRPGVITQEQMESVVGSVTMFLPPPTNELPEALPSPGVGLRHYAPRARLILVEADNTSALRSKLLKTAADLAAGGDSVGLMLPSGWEQTAQVRAIYHWGGWQDCDALAERLFAGLRELDAAGVSVIVCPLPAARGVGVAIRDRLLKAAR
jgi:L-threonylcarbamoyladenylate synthase